MTRKKPASTPPTPDPNAANSVAQINNITIFTHENTVWLSTDPPRPAPEVMSTAEAMIYLRIPISKRGVRTLRYYQSKGKLKGFRAGKEIVFRLEELRRFVREQEQHE
ncbi:MAG: helix-turn-helix domain-containing protein [Phycisphaerales bacterium]|nr:helix-turn-helix domain-containing protein [Phycisphaerales bacterium]